MSDDYKIGYYDGLFDNRNNERFWANYGNNEYVAGFLDGQNRVGLIKFD